MDYTGIDFLEVLIDATYASTAIDNRSVSGGIMMCGGEQLVVCFSKMQICVTLPTSEAGYVSLTDGTSRRFYEACVAYFLV